LLSVSTPAVSVWGLHMSQDVDGLNAPLYQPAAMLERPNAAAAKELLMSGGSMHAVVLSTATP